MIYNESFLLKNVSLRFLFICCSLIASYIIFISIVSIVTGLNHLQQEGFWMPVLVGTTTITMIFYLLSRLFKFISNQMKEPDSLNR